MPWRGIYSRRQNPHDNSPMIPFLLAHQARNKKTKKGLKAGRDETMSATTTEEFGRLGKTIFHISRNRLCALSREQFGSPDIVDDKVNVRLHQL
jgi:hypothetical protein